MNKQNRFDAMVEELNALDEFIPQLVASRLSEKYNIPEREIVDYIEAPYREAYARIRAVGNKPLYDK